MRPSRDGARNVSEFIHSLQGNEAISLTSRLAIVRVGIREMSFYELGLLRSFMTAVRRLDKVVCFAARIPQFYDLLRSHGEASSFKIVLKQL